MPNIARLVFLSLLWVPTVPADTLRPGVHDPRLEEAIKSNQADVADTAGQRYENRVIHQYQETYAAVLHDCIGPRAVADLAPFDMVLVIGRDGAVTQVLVGPVTEVSRCLRARLLRAQFPNPPFAPFHSHIHMTFSR